MKNSIKKVIAGLSVAAMFASVMPIVNAWYDDEVDTNDFITSEVNGGVTIVEYVGPSSDEIIIPEEIKGQKVLRIDTLAFASVSNDVKIYVPETVNAQQSGWKPFLTAGAIDKGIIENVPAEQRNPIGIVQYWGKIAGISDDKLSTEFIKNRMNTEIDKLIDKVKGLVPDLGDDPFASFDTIIDKLPNPDKFVELQKELDDAMKELADLNIDLNEEEYQHLDNDQLNAKIAEKIANATGKVTEATDKINAELAKVQEDSAKIKEEVAKLNDLKTKLEEQLDPAAFEAEIDKILTEEPIKTIFDAPDKVVAALKDKVVSGSSLTSAALKEIKDYKESPADYIANWELSDTNVARLKKAMDKIEIVAEKIPYAGITLLSTENNTALQDYAKSENIMFEVGEPTEPTTAPVQTSISVSEVVVTVPGSDVTRIETVTVPVDVTQPKETVTVISEVPEVSVSVSVSVSVETVIETVLVTESTTAKKDVLKGDTNLDGKISLNDAVWIAEYMNNKRVLTDDQFEAADHDDNGSVSLNDAIYVAEKILEEM